LAPSGLLVGVLMMFALSLLMSSLMVLLPAGLTAVLGSRIAAAMAGSSCAEAGR
jgi:hypothetical protein